MPGYLPFFLRFLWTEKKSRSIKRRKGRGQNPDILTEQALSTTDLSWPKREHFSYGTNAIYPERARMAWVASNNTGFALSCPLGIRPYNKIPYRLHPIHWR